MIWFRVIFPDDIYFPFIVCPGREVRFIANPAYLHVWDAPDHRFLPLEEMKRVEVQEVAIDRGVSWEDALGMYNQAVENIQRRVKKTPKKGEDKKVS